MEIVNTQELKGPQKAEEAASHIFTQLETDNFFSKVSLLLLSGGSCVDVAAALVSLIPADIDLGSLTVALADERWVLPQSQDSNEQQLRQQSVIQKLEDRGARFVSMLGVDSDPTRAANQIHHIYKRLFSETEAIALLAGMGPDGHTLGILPDANASRFFERFSGDQVVSYYQLDQTQDNPFKERLTVTFSAVGKMSHIFLYAVGEPKKPALAHFYHKDVPLNSLPVLGLYLTETVPVVLTDISV